jgi:peptidoglycan/xylan/chitin deacetylase (PgdA/CDA1 family)
MRHLLITFVILLFVQSTTAQKKQICFSFDDMPVVNYGITDSVYQQQLMDKLVFSLHKHHIPAIGFVNAKKLFNTEGTIIHFQVAMLKHWAESGLDIGNHTFSHPDYNEVSFSEYANNITKGEPILIKILAGYGRPLRYFRHPFLHVGNTKEKADSLNTFLKAHGYIVAPVTIDNEDYLFALAYKRASEKKDTTLMRQIRSNFVTYIGNKADYYEKQSQVLFGRNIPQVLLLHASLLNADCTDSLAAMFEEKQYEFAAMDDVLKDSVFQIPITVYSDWGISWIDRWALSAGKQGDFFKEDPVSPGYIKKMAE